MTVVTIGETMGLFTATTAGARPETFRRGIGGAESNVAIGLARLGRHSAWLGRLGDDAAGDLVERELRAEGVQSFAIRDAGAPTGLMVKSQPVPGHSRVDYHRVASAGSRLTPDDIDPELIASAELLHVSGITLALSTSAAAAVEHAVTLAVAAAVPVSFDLNHRSRLWGDRSPVAAYRSIAERATVLFAGEDEAALLVSGANATEQAEQLAQLGAPQVLVKRGADGCVALIDGRAFAVDAVPVAVIDTVGAGDAFAAGYLAELLEGLDAGARVVTAVRCGAFACLGAGDWESLPHRRDLGLLDAFEPVVR